MCFFMEENMVKVIVFALIIFLLGFIYCSCKLAGEADRKMEGKDNENKENI